MPTFEVTLKDRTIERIDGADAYQQEGPMTTFFRRRLDRTVVDTWSTRVASFRTSEIVIIRRIEGAAEPSRCDRPDATRSAAGVPPGRCTRTS